MHYLPLSFLASRAACRASRFIALLRILASAMRNQADASHLYRDKVLFCINNIYIVTWNMIRQQTPHKSLSSDTS